MKSFAKRLKTLRETRKLSQKDLAQILGVQVALISRYERGLSVPSAATIIDLAKALQVTTDHLLIGSTKDSEAPQIRHAVLLNRFQQIDEQIDDRKELDAIVSFLEAFLAKKQIRRMASSGG